MKMNVYTMRDLKSEFTSNLFCDLYDDVAIRKFVQLVRTPNTMPHDFPNDFSLYKIAEFDCETGLVTSLVVPELLFDGSNAKERVLND